MGLFNKIFGRDTLEDPDAPFMEHPSGPYENATVAIADAINRLRKTPAASRTMVFTAQGQGADGMDNLAFYEIRYIAGNLDVGETPVNHLRLCQLSGVNPDQIAIHNNRINIAQLPPIEAARLIDAIYRHHFELIPFPDEENDYAVGAEWDG